MLNSLWMEVECKHMVRSRLDVHVQSKLSMIGRHVLSDASIAPADEYSGCY